jgi:hypothetical protein
MLLIVTTAPQPRSVRAQELTVPPSQLPDGCRLTPAASVNEGSGRVRGGLWGGFAVSSNPWSGAEPVMAGKIRLRVEGSPRVVDGPPSRSDLARQALRLGDDVDEAYAAFYAGPDDALISVYAIKLKPSKASIGDTFGRAASMMVGPYRVAHFGPGDACHEAVVKHLLSLGR